MRQRDITSWAITQTIRDAFTENVELRRTRVFLGAALAVSVATNIVFALKFIFG